MADATSAVREWIAHQRTRGVKLPAARDVEAVLADPGSEFNSENEALVVISLERRKPRPPKGKPSKARVSARAA